jgi:hypothetical protein
MEATNDAIVAPVTMDEIDVGKPARSDPGSCKKKKHRE